MDKLIGGIQLSTEEFNEVAKKCIDKFNKQYLLRLFENLDYDKLKNLQLTCTHEYDLERMLVHNEFEDLIQTILAHCQR